MINNAAFLDLFDKTFNTYVLNKGNVSVPGSDVRTDYPSPPVGKLPPGNVGSGSGSSGGGSTSTGVSSEPIEISLSPQPGWYHLVDYCSGQSQTWMKPGKGADKNIAGYTRKVDSSGKVYYTMPPPRCDSSHVIAGCLTANGSCAPRASQNKSNKWTCPAGFVVIDNMGSSSVGVGAGPAGGPASMMPMMYAIPFCYPGSVCPADYKVDPATGNCIPKNPRTYFDYGCDPKSGKPCPMTAGGAPGGVTSTSGAKSGGGQIPGTTDDLTKGTTGTTPPYSFPPLSLPSVTNIQTALTQDVTLPVIGKVPAYYVVVAAGLGLAIIMFGGKKRR